MLVLTVDQLINWQEQPNTDDPDTLFEMLQLASTSLAVFDHKYGACARRIIRLLRSKQYDDAFTAELQNLLSQQIELNATTDQLEEAMLDMELTFRQVV